MNDELKPRDHAEAVALFRAQIVGPLLVRELRHGELRAELRRLSRMTFRPPGLRVTRRYSVPTLERWLYRYKNGGLSALRPARRSDAGHARALTDAQRALVVDIAREHPTASADLILRTLVNDGRLEAGLISAPTLRRFLATHGLDRRTRRQLADGRVRQRWEAARPGVLWHADVCHGPALRIDGRSVPLRIHAILDDASRYVVAIQACTTELEVEMLALFAKSVRAWGCPETLYLDNGPTYSGEMLLTATGRLDVTLVHARPYDPQSRGKMERFWRTLRAGCLDHIGTLGSLHDVQVRLLAWLDRHYHRAPHAGLMGRAPGEVWGELERRDVDEDDLARALTARGRRRVRRDGTVAIGGIDWETNQGFLAGRVAQIGRNLLDPQAAPWIEHEGRTYALTPVDPKANAKRERAPFRPKPGIDAVRFDPAGALLDRYVGRAPEGEA